MSLAKQLRGAAIAAFLGPPGSAVLRVADRARRLRSGEPRRVELYYQADDPYSYLLAQVLPRLRRRYPTDFRFLLAPAPAPEADPAPEARARYAVRDAARLAERFDVEFPAEAELPAAALVREANQILACDRPIDAQLDAALVVGDALWRGDASALSAAARRLGTAPESVDAVLRESDARRAARGHYLGGMLLYRGEWFWGIDRLHYLESRLRAEHGYPAGDSVLQRRVLGDRRRPGGDATTGRRTASEPAAPLSSDVAQTPELELYFSFRSPYSYLALDRTFRLAERHGLRLTVKSVLPMVMRGMKVPAAKRIYIVRDCKREADRLGVPFGRICDPLGPGVERCLALQRHARQQGRELELLRSAGRGIWAEALDVADERDLRRIAERAGLAWPDCQRALADPAWRAEVDENRVQLLSLGLWGVPCFRFAGVTTWGQDRIAMLEDLVAARA